MKKDYPKGWVGLAVPRKILEKVQNIHLLLVYIGYVWNLFLSRYSYGEVWLAI